MICIFIKEHLLHENLNRNDYLYAYNLLQNSSSSHTRHACNKSMNALRFVTAFVTEDEINTFP